MVPVLRIETYQLFVVLLSVRNPASTCVEVRQLLPHPTISYVFLQDRFVDVDRFLELALLEEPLRLLLCSLPIKCH